jgi:hypothetical protein
MSFEVYPQCFGETERSGISPSAVRSLFLFPVIEQASEPDYWRVHFYAKNSCHIGVTARAPNQERLKSLYVDRPRGDPRLWAALFSILRMRSLEMFWPAGPLLKLKFQTGLASQPFASPALHGRDHRRAGSDSHFFSVNSARKALTPKAHHCSA